MSAPRQQRADARVVSDADALKDALVVLVGESPAANREAFWQDAARATRSIASYLRASRPQAERAAKDQTDPPGRVGEDQ